MSVLERNELINQLSERVEMVEKRLSQVERPYPVIHVPSLNELRYALVHLLRYLRDETNQEKEAENAFKHVRRAHYDCYEAEALFYFKEITQFEETFKEIYILKHIPEYLEWSFSYNDLRDFMQSFSKEDRDKYCDELEQKLSNIRPIHSKLKTARLELLKYVEKLTEENEKLLDDKLKAEEELKIARMTIDVREKSLRQVKISNIIAISTAILAAITGITGLLLSLSGK